MTCGIYKVQNQLNGKLYIGSSRNCEYRKQHHFTSLRKNKHFSRKLQNAWNKYGEEAFIFLIIEECLEFELTLREQFWLDFFEASTKGYNTRPKAESNRGYKFSAETKKKLSDAQKTRERSLEELALMGERRAKANIERGPLSLEIRQKISQSHLKRSEEMGIPQRRQLELKNRLTREEIQKKITAANTGKKRTKEQKRHISDSLLGHVCSEETKKKISDAKKGKSSWNKGKACSEETRKKISETKKLKKESLTQICLNV